jgi:hypothetical protein
LQYKEVLLFGSIMKSLRAVSSLSRKCEMSANGTKLSSKLLHSFDGESLARNVAFKSSSHEKNPFCV